MDKIQFGLFRCCNWLCFAFAPARASRTVPGLFKGAAFASMSWVFMGWVFAFAFVPFQPFSSYARAEQAVNADQVEAGQKQYKKCKSCHEIGAEARNKAGPHLNGVFGRLAGSIEGFKYSKAMKKAGEDGLIWDEASLDQYLKKPRAFIKGTRMGFAGMRKDEDRAILIAYLKFSASPKSAAKGETTDQGNAALAMTPKIAALEADPDYGQYLSGDCVTCHQISGNAEGIPSIIGLPKNYFITALLEYKFDIRDNKVMKLRVANLSDEEIAALAAYFSKLEPQ